MPDKLPVAPIPGRDRFGWRDWTVLTLALALAVGIWHVDATSVANRRIGYSNRAAICDFTREFGGIEPASCNDPALAPYRDPRIQPGEGERRNTTRLLCLILVTLHQAAAQCAGGG